MGDRRVGGVVAVLAGALGAVLLSVSSGLGATPSTSYDTSRVDSPDPQATGRWAERLATASDLTGDGVNDLFIAALSENVAGRTNAGKVYLLSGADRSVRYEISSPEIQQNAQFGFYIQVLGDVNGDGKDDLAAGTDAQDVGTHVDQGKAWVFSGATGRLLYDLDNPAPQGTADNSARFGSRIGRAGDVNGDGVPDVIVGASNNDVPAGCGDTSPPPAGCHKNQGQAFIFSGKPSDHAGGASGLIRTLDLPDPAPAPCTANCGTFGLAVQGPGDVDGDGVTDQLVDAGNLTVGGNAGQGRMYLFSGDENGKLLARIDDPAPQAGATFGFQDAAPLSPGDLNGDGSAEIFAGGFGQNGPAGEEVAGRAWIFNGKATVQQGPAGPGVLLFEAKDPTPTVGGTFGWSLAKTDYNHDRTPDLYVGSAPHHTAGTDQNGGTYVFDGRDGSLLKPFELPVSDRQGSTVNTGPNLGWGLAAPGDLNGDGESDYTAGAPFLDVGANADQGRLYVFLSRVSAVPGGGGPTPGPSELAGCPPARAARNVLALTSGNDTRNGTPGDDLIFAGAGDDVIDGLGGDDCIDLGLGRDRGQGGSGNDFLVGGLGNDVISGSSGRDSLRGNAGDDRLTGGTGSDRILGGTGLDRIFGGFGNDSLHGQSGADRISGSRGRDRINGGRGNDRLAGDSSPDRINGDSGNDRIDGGSSGDLLRGNSGGDRITGKSGRDRISGGAGNDRIDGRDRRGGDRISCGRGRDTVLADRGDRVARDCERVLRR